MKLATWNVNGIRARHAQVQAWIERERPDVVCLQELKAAPDQVPITLCEMEGYWCYWHGGNGYSGVGLLVSKAFAPRRPVFSHPAFDFENRIVAVEVPIELGHLTVASIYVPVTSLLQDRFKMPVKLEHDVTTAAYGEWSLGAGTDPARLTVDGVEAIRLAATAGLPFDVVTNEELSGVPAFKAFGKQAQPVAIEPQQLHQIAPPTAERKDVARERILQQRHLRQRRQTVHALSHVGHSGSEPHPGA